MLDSELIESRAQSLQSKQEFLTTELQLSDLQMQFNDVIGLPLTAALVLDPNVVDSPDSCAKEECIKIALASHPEIAEARATVDKAASAVRLAKYEYVPDVQAFARYTYSNDVPFLARNFGSFGIHVGYDLFDGGKRRATLREREAQLAQVRRTLPGSATKSNSECRQPITSWRGRGKWLRFQKSYWRSAKNPDESPPSSWCREVRCARKLRRHLPRSSRLTKALLLQSQLDYIQAHDEMTQAIGKTPE